MTLRPVVSVGDGAITLSLDVDEAGTVVGWQTTNATGLPGQITLVAGAFSASRALPAGTVSGSVPNNRRWALDTADSVSYGLTVAWRR